MVPINFSGKLTRKDFMKVLSLHNRQLGRQKWFFGFIIVIMILSFLYLAITRPSDIAGLIPGLLFILLIFSFPWWAPYIQVLSFNQEGMIYRDTVFGVIDDAGISINTDRVKAEFQWTSYSGYRLKDNLVLLYQGKTNFHVFMKSMFANENDWSSFLSTVNQRLPLKK